MYPVRLTSLVRRQDRKFADKRCSDELVNLERVAKCVTKVESDGNTAEDSVCIIPR